MADTDFKDNKIKDTNNSTSSELDLSNKDVLGFIRYPRNQAQADFIIPKRKIDLGDGKFVYKKITTIADEKIADACIQTFQQSNLSKNFDYKEMRILAENKLDDRFKKYNMIVSEKNSDDENNKIKKNREVAIAQEIREYIANEIKTTYVVDFDRFISMTGIKTAEQRIGNALKMLTEVQDKAFYEYKEEIISEDFSTIEFKLKRVPTIPSIGLVLDREMGSKYNTYTEFVNSDVKNKRKHIRGIEFDINKSYLSAILALGKDYVSVSRKFRDNFSSSYSFRLHTLLKSIEKVQHMDTYNKFDFHSIQKKFGTSFKDYRNFKMRVLTPAIKDINLHTDLMVELKEHRDRKEITYIKFRITRKIGDDKKTKFGVDVTAYYIASRLFYFSSEKIQNILAFAKHIEKNLESTELQLYGDKYLEEWKIEAKKAVEIELEIIDFMDKQRRAMKEKGLIYDEKRMCIIQLVNTEKNPDVGDYTPVEKKKLINTSDYQVTNPMQSLDYLYEICKDVDSYTPSIIEYLPFTIATTKGWEKIETIKDYVRHEEKIKFLIFEKKVESIKFNEENIFSELFYTNMMRENFKEITSDFKKMVKRLTKSKKSDADKDSGFDDFNDFE